MSIHMYAEQVPALQLGKGAGEAVEPPSERPHVPTTLGHSVTKVRDPRWTLVELQLSVEDALNRRKDQVEVSLAYRRREFALIQLIRGLANNDLEVRPCALPRARRVVEARGRTANSICPHWGLVMNISDTL